MLNNLAHTVKMVVTDLDDTLLRSDLTISKQTKAAINAALAKGVVMVLASGRMYASILPYAAELGLAAPVIACNGAEIIDPVTRLAIYERPLSAALASKMAAYADSIGLYIQVYYGDEYYFNKVSGKWPAFYKRTSGVEGHYVPDMASFIDKPTPKLLVIEEPDKIPGLLEDFKFRFSDEAEVAMSKPMYLELTHKDATKRDACIFLAEKLGIARQNVMCCGDGLNDLSMLKWAGLGVCVENAREYVREAADYVVPSCDDDGVAEAIRRFVLSD